MLLPGSTTNSPQDLCFRRYLNWERDPEERISNGDLYNLVLIIIIIIITFAGTHDMVCTVLNVLYALSSLILIANPVR